MKWPTSSHGCSTVPASAAACALLLAGCTAPKSFPSPFRGVSGAIRRVIPGTGETSPEPITDPLVIAALQLTEYGVTLIVIGLVFGALTKFRTGWGKALVASGIGMILLAWTFDHPYLPYAALLSLAAYAAYKLWNRLNPTVPTEPLLD
ncbi:MAG: hypothetical protein JJU00_20080 [Opitutales bacterium]|nr:hypothetical protein [Opitutales bacterium]